MTENNIGTYSCKYIGMKDGTFLKGKGTSIISIKRKSVPDTVFWLKIYVLAITQGSIL